MKAKILKSVGMLNEDTLEIVFEDNMLIDLEGIKEAYIEFDKFFAKNRRLKRLVVMGKNTEITKEARKYGEIENEKRKSTCIAEAMVVFTFVQKMVTNFYLKYIKDLYPTRSFTDINEAREWLLNYEESPKRSQKKALFF
jgi:hypothetical protein